MIQRTACKAISFFLSGQETTSLESLGDGNVNDTWLVVTADGNKYVLQRLNPFVFPDPGLVQDNLCIITRHLQHRLKQVNRDFTVAEIIRNPEGAQSYTDNHGAWWRLLSYIDNTVALSTISTTEQAREIGHTLGLFHQLASSLPLSSLADPLPGFHNTPLYLKQYDALLETARQRAADCRDFIDERRQDVFLLEIARSQGTIRQQVIHGDPKVANFLFSSDLHRVISLIDFDTVKPGLLLHDIGDCLRSCCNISGEDREDPDNVIFDQDFFAAALAGYFATGSDLLSETDRDLLVHSVRLISFELGLRFYSDYLAGNRYFKVESPEQNLFRARVQFALVRSIESKYSELMKICSAVRDSTSL